MSSMDPWEFSTWGVAQLAERVHDLDSLDDALGLAVSLEPLAVALGQRSAPLLDALATLGSADLSVARAVEPHLDATAILAQAARQGVEHPSAPEGGTWGVFAASPPGEGVHASPDGTSGGWRLRGSKPWCSLADRVSHALVTASDEEGRQGLFAIALAGVDFDASAWQPLGLREITTGTLRFDGQQAQPVGGPGWYLERPGFSWGGVCVAAVWFGASAALAGSLWEAARRRRPDQIALQHIGTCDVLLHGAHAVLRDAAEAMDDPGCSPADSVIVAARVRAHVASVAEQVMTTVGHALGPGPLALDLPHLTRVADLTLYLRQHHAERDLARLGHLVTGDAARPDAQESR
ncbi:MAG: acyl-CoA dehydrogenase [Ornithinibacter sp.]